MSSWGVSLSKQNALMGHEQKEGLAAAEHVYPTQLCLQTAQ